MISKLKNFFNDKNGKTTIFQSPNASLTIWFLFTCIAKVLPSGNWQLAATVVSFVSIIIWAMQEITLGDSTFRRVLGVVILLATLQAKLL